jgi:hypothetical protein
MVMLVYRTFGGDVTHFLARIDAHESRSEALRNQLAGAGNNRLTN